MRRNQALFLFPWTYCIVKLFYGNRNSSFTEKLQNQSYWQTWQTPFGWQGKQREAGPFGRSRKMRRHESQSGERARGRERERERERERGVYSERVRVLRRLEPFSRGYGQIARARLLPSWQDTKLSNQPRPFSTNHKQPSKHNQFKWGHKQRQGPQAVCVCVCVCLGWEGGRWSNVFVWDPIKKRREREREQKGPKQNKKKKKQHSWWLLTLWP